MCQLHYRRSRVHGDPHHTNRRSPSDGRGYRNINGKGEHVLVAERALGRPLPAGAVVHHVNCDKSDNRPENLVICPGTLYHALIHVRMRALDATGNANFRKCKICGRYDDPSALTFARRGAIYHAACNRAHVAEIIQRRKK
jgi:hypothetical protein